MTKVTIYTTDQRTSIPWPETPMGDFTRRYLSPFLEQGTRSLIANVDTDMNVITVDDVVLPFTVGQRGAQNSYVCAPYSHYILYAREELRELDSWIERRAMGALLHPLAAACRWGAIDDAVMVNNWLLSTNLYPPLTQSQTESILRALIERYPDKPIIFRSIDLACRADLHQWLCDAGCRMVASRRVNISARGDKSVWSRSNTKYDLKLLSRSPYTLHDGDDLSEAEFQRIVQLYGYLYLEKYSYLNPQFQPNMLRHMRDEKLWRFQVFKKDGIIDSACVTFLLNGVATAPIIGYDTSASQELGLYRLAYVRMLKAGEEADATVNCSAGVAHFKRLRGALPSLEYNAVYDEHLGPKRRFPWWLLRFLMDRLVVPAMEKQDL